jgi:hypothetical protein
MIKCKFFLEFPSPKMMIHLAPCTYGWLVQFVKEFNIFFRRRIVIFSCISKRRGYNR